MNIQNNHIKIISKNKKAFRDFIIIDKYEAGLVLKGTEVKSIKNNGANITDSFAKIINNEVILYNMHIGHYSHGNIYNCDPIRERKLLLHKREIKKINATLKEKGFSLIALSLYLTKGLVKIEIGIGKGKKLYDKRETLKKKTQDREINSHIKNKF